MARYPVRFTGNPSSLLYRDNYELPPFPSDEEQATAVAMAKSNPLAAKECLTAFALRIRYEMSIADNLADHIATALEIAAAEPASKSTKALTDALGLTARGRRPSSDLLTVGRYIEDQIDEGRSETAAIKLAAVKYETDVRTAGRYLAEYRVAEEKSRSD